MSGGKSKSSSASTQQQITTDVGASGNVGSDIVSLGTGIGNVSYVNTFSPEVAGFAENLLQLVGEGFGQAFGLVDKSMGHVVSTSQQAAQPDLTVLKQQTAYLPVLIIGAMAMVGLVAWRAFK